MMVLRERVMRKRFILERGCFYLKAKKTLMRIPYEEKTNAYQYRGEWRKEGPDYASKSPQESSCLLTRRKKDRKMAALF